MVETGRSSADTNLVIRAELGYLAGALTVLAVWGWWLRRGRAVTNDVVADMVTRASNAPPGWRWTWGHWSSERTRRAAEQGQAGFWMWLPLVIFLPVIAAVFLASAVAEIAR
jgi:hypothetical protein